MMIIQLPYQVFDILRQILILSLLSLLHPLNLSFHLLILLNKLPYLLSNFNLLKHRLCSGDHQLRRRYLQLYLEL